MSKKIVWNDKASQYLTSLQREAIERGESPRRMEGTIRTDENGRVWYVAGEHQKLVGEGGRPTLADGRPADESAATGKLGGLPATSGKKTPKSAAKKATPRKRK